MWETKKKFLEGSLHPANVLMCPHTCVTNLPKPREHHSGMKTGLESLATVVVAVVVVAVVVVVVDL